MEPIKVMVVDDSALIRRIVKDMLNEDPRFTVVSTARDGVDALEKIAKLSPDLITLDVEMPRMDGLQTLKEIVRRFQVPVIMLSSRTQRGSHVTMEALSLGAVDFIPKPEKIHEEAMRLLQVELLAKAAAAGRFKVQTAPLPKPKTATTLLKPTLSSARKIVAIGSSTGGPRALEAILLELPADLPAAVLITQHMPPNFTRALAERLDKLSAIRIKEAEHDEPVLSGVAYVAPGNYHMELTSEMTIRLTQDPPVEHVRPSVTVMMRSIAALFGRHTLGVILTGMGKDGSVGMEAIKQHGGTTLVQDEASSVVFSMPRAVIQLHVADRILPLNEIAGAITSICRGTL